MKKFFVSLLLAMTFVTTAAPASAQTVLRNFIFTLDFEGGTPIQGSIFDELGIDAPNSGTLVVRGLADTTEPFFNRYDVTINGIQIDNNLSSFLVGPDVVRIGIREEDSSRVNALFRFVTPDGLFLGYSPSGEFDQQAILGLGTFQLSSNATLTVAPVPEPATWLLFILGFGLLGFVMRRRRKIEFYHSQAYLS